MAGMTIATQAAVKTEHKSHIQRVATAVNALEEEFPGIHEGIKDVFTGGLWNVASLLYDKLFTPEMILQAYAAYDSDKRTNGIYDFEAFSDAVLGVTEEPKP